jgi:energy-coupling factor transporter ATP-binding protein EcfA2
LLFSFFSLFFFTTTKIKKFVVKNILATFAKKYFFMAENDKKEYRNWYKRLLRIQKKELILFVVLILLAFIFVGISSDICKWLKTKVIYDIVNNKLLINIPICIIISGFAIWWWIKIWKDKDIRPYRLGLIISLFIIIYYSKVKYANIVGIINYKIFFLFLLKVSFYIIALKFFLIPVIISNLWKFIVEIAKEVKGKFIEDSNFYIEIKEVINALIYKQDNKGFSVDDTEIKLSINQIIYAETLVTKLKNTDLSKESFAVGITGEWGSGKSTFLNTMKKEIKEAKFAEIVEFNPWLCNSPEQVTQDFFATLINELSPKHSTLSRDLNKYAKLLNKIAKASLSFFGIDLDLTPGDDSLNKLKENISKKLAKLPKKVVILIDDTDRLEGNEIFEILRLIRNTADFRNVIYIATYDKEYVTDVLKENKIKDPDNYLEKIFQTEVHLPKIEDYELWETLMKEIEISEDDDFIQNLNDNKKLILKILTNYRKIKRFARKYLLFKEYLYSYTINLIDLFWLQLLHTYDKKTYNILENDPFKLLKEDNLNQVKLFKLKDDFYENIQNEQTEEILQNMFREGPKKIGDIQLIEFYDRYFSMNISKYKLTIKEYFDFIESAPNDNKNKISYIEDKIKEWLKDKKDIDSILYYFNNTNIRNKFDMDFLKNKIYSLLSLIYIDPSISINKIHFLNRDKWHNDIDNIPLSYFKGKFVNCKSDDDFIKLSTLLNKLYTKEIYMPTKETKDILIISSYSIIEYLCNIINKYLNNNKDSVKIYDLISEDKPLSQIFKNCCVTNKVTTKFLGKKTKGPRQSESSPSEQIALATIIQFFNGKLSKDTLDDFILKCFNLEDKKHFFGTDSIPNINELRTIQTNG